MRALLRRVLGFDTPYVTDQAPPLAVRREQERSQALAALAQQRRVLLERVVVPEHQSRQDETQLHNEIRRHLRETRRYV